MDLDDLRAASSAATQAQVLVAYRAGLFPMGVDAGGSGAMGWWAPRRRGVLLPGSLRVTKSLRKSMRHFTYSVDRDFEQVIRACADPSRRGRWITPEIIRLYTGLHHSGWAHSVEVWSDEDLVGGLYGIGIGSLFAGESMFHTATDASKAALVHLVGCLDGTVDADRQPAPHVPSDARTELSNDMIDDAESTSDEGRNDAWMIDTQWSTSHLQSLGVSEISGLDYASRLDSALLGNRVQGFLNK